MRHTLIPLLLLLGCDPGTAPAGALEASADLAPDAGDAGDELEAPNTRADGSGIPGPDAAGDARAELPRDAGAGDACTCPPGYELTSSGKCLKACGPGCFVEAPCS